MRNVWLLLKNYFLCGIGSLRRKNARAKTIAGVTTIAVLYFGFFAFMLYSMLLMAKESAPINMQASVLAIGLIISVFLAVIFALQKVTGGKKSNDTELLLSMPFKKTEIITAKALSSFVFNLAIVILMFLPNVIAYIVYTPFDIVAILGCSVMMLMIPLTAVGLSYIVDFLVTVCFSDSKFGNIFKAFFTLITLVGVMVIYEFLVMNIDDPVIMLNVVNWMITFNPIVMVPVIGGAVLIFIIGNWLNALLLNRENRASQAKPTRISSKNTTPLMSLLKNESNRYFNSTGLMLNTMIGPLFMVVLTGYLAIQGKSLLSSELLQMLGIQKEMACLLIGLIFAACAVLTYPAAVSISLEGKQLWILRSMPIHAQTILTAKALFNIILVVPLTLVCTIVIQITLQLSILSFIVMTLIPILTAILVSYAGIMINLYFPKFEFTNEVAVIKQSLSATIMLLGGMLAIGALTGLSFWLMNYLSVVAIAGILIGILTLTSGIAIALTYTLGRRIFNHL